MFNDDDSATGDLISVSGPRSDDFTDDDEPMDVDREPVGRNKAGQEKARTKSTAKTTLSPARPATKRKVMGTKTKTMSVGIDDESGGGSHKRRKDEQPLPNIIIKDAPGTTSTVATIPQSQNGHDNPSLSDSPLTSPSTSPRLLVPSSLSHTASSSTNPLAPAPVPVSTPNAQSVQLAGLQDVLRDKVAGVELAGHGHEIDWTDSQDWDDGGDHESRFVVEHDKQPPCLSDPFHDIFNKKRAPVAGGNLGTSATIPVCDKQLLHPRAPTPGASSWKHSSTRGEKSRSTQVGTSHPRGQAFNPVPLGSGPAHSAKFSSNDQVQQRRSQLDYVGTSRL
ncbi:hypothetical protein BDR05DRAFT_1006969 [Suillus weaverae]|nr:hypothetical protein BDR05DRAFT_1006969 [Suillus weaverae]